MFRTLLHAIVVAAGVVTAAWAQQSAPPRPTDPALLAELDRDIWRPFVAAYAARDAEAYLALHTAALVRVPADMKRVQTTEQWRSSMRAMFRQMNERGDTAAIAFRFNERLAGAEAASERGVYELTIKTADGSVQRFYGRFHTIARKEQGRWKLAVDYDSSEGGAVDAAAFRAAHAMDDYPRY